LDIPAVNPDKIRYTDASNIGSDYTNRMNKAYNWMAKGYDAFMFVFPLWKKWIKEVIPHIEGEKVLEVSFGNGYLMTQYAKDDYDIYGIDYNDEMLGIASRKMVVRNIDAQLSKANVERIPFPDNTFDTVINTMAFTGYPDGDSAMSELKRVLKKDGKLLLVDFDYPIDRNLMGYLTVRLWERLGDIIKDISTLLTKYDFDFKDQPIGGFGSVHLFIARKRD
jgi:ubiquinone/menaquinone biosynthesis C-methylase UbiE